MLVLLWTYGYALLLKTRAMADLILSLAAAALLIAEWVKSPKYNSSSWSFKYHFRNWWDFLLESDALTLLDHEDALCSKLMQVKETWYAPRCTQRK